MILKSELRKIVVDQREELNRDLGTIREMLIGLLPEFATIIS